MGSRYTPPEGIRIGTGEHPAFIVNITDRGNSNCQKNSFLTKKEAMHFFFQKVKEFDQKYYKYAHIWLKQMANHSCLFAYTQKKGESHLYKYFKLKEYTPIPKEEWDRYFDFKI